MRPVPDAFRRAGPVFLALGLLAAPAGPSPAARGAPAATLLSAGGEGLPRVAVVLLPSLQWPELRDALRAGAVPHLRRVAREGAVGLVNTATGGRPLPGDAYASLGAGARVNGAPAAGEAYGRAERADGVPAEALYALRLGRPAPAGAVLHLGLAALRRSASALPYRAEPGALGESLRSAGIPVAVLGNADVFRAAPVPAGAASIQAGPGRWAAALAMDARGVVPRGAVGQGTLRADPMFPGGWRSDEAVLAALAARELDGGGLVVVETGDLWRLLAEEGHLAPAAYDRLRREALARADRLVGDLMARLDPRRDLLVVLNPVAGASRGDGTLLAPALAWGGGLPAGLLASGTTRHAGLVANVDLAPTVLAAFGLPVPNGMYGKPWHVVRAPSPSASLAAVDALHARTLANHLRRPLLVQSYVLLAIAALLAALAGALLRLPWRRGVRPLLAAVASVPLAYLLLGLLPPLPPWASGAAAAALTTLLASLALLLGGGDDARPLSLLAGLTALAVALDGLTGSRLMEGSPLGHSLVAGARFYGVGNEYAGVLLGSSLVAGGAALDAGRGRPLALLAVGLSWGAALLVLAAPGAGANFGGALATAIAYALALMRLKAPRLGGRHLVAAGVLAAAVVLGAALADSVREVAVQSHGGRAVLALRAGDWETLRDLVARKVEMNARLARWTRWSAVFLVSLLSFAWLTMRPPAALATLLARRPGLAAGFVGTAAGSLAALLANDSGIVAAATSLVYASASLLALVLSSTTPARPPSP